MDKFKNYFHNHFKLIIIVISVILVINIVLMGYLIYKYSQRKNYAPNPVSVDAEYEFTFDNRGEILGITHTTDSNSKKIQASKVSKQIEAFATEFIPHINKNVIQNTDITPEKFFAENKNYIFQYAGISEKKEFVELCKELKNSECNLNELCGGRYVDNTASYINNILNVEIVLKDKEGKTIKVSVKTSSKSENRFTYKIIK